MALSPSPQGAGLGLTVESTFGLAQRARGRGLSVRAARERRGDLPRDLGCPPALGNARPLASIPASSQDLPELTGELQAPVLMGAGIPLYFLLPVYWAGRHGMETDPHVQWLLHTGLWAEAGKYLTYERKGGFGQEKRSLVGNEHGRH